MYCNHCGAEIPEQAQYCQNCGGKVGATVKKHNPWLLGLAAIAVLILLVIFAKFVLFGGTAEAPKEPMPFDTPVVEEVPVEEPKEEPPVIEPVAEEIPVEEPAPEPEPEPEPEPKTPSAPDPARYFGANREDVEFTTLWLFEFTADPTDAINNYLFLLQTDYGLSMLETHDGGNYTDWLVQTGTDPEAYVSMQLDPTEGHWYLWMKFGANITLTEGEIWENPLPLWEEPEMDPSVLPDFLAADSSGSFRQGTTSTPRMVVFSADTDTLQDTVEAYIQSLLDMGYRIDDREIKNGQYSEVYRWYLAHDEVGGSTVEGNAQVCVKYMIMISYFDKSRSTEVSIEYGSGVSYSGESKTGSSSSGGSVSTEKPDYLDTKRPCNICHRSGDCQTCGGDGYLWSSANDKENRNCYSCSGGRCRTCGGDGWIS